jgi:hypothetical protein
MYAKSYADLRSSSSCVCAIVQGDKMKYLLYNIKHEKARPSQRATT